MKDAVDLMNFSRPHVRKVVSQICAAALFGVTAGASAQMLYKQVDVTGRVIFTNLPDALPSPQMSPQMTRVSVTFNRQVDGAGRFTFPERGDSMPPSRRTVVSALDVASALARNAVISSPWAHLIDANEAVRRLEQAQRERKEGAALRPGERAQPIDASGGNNRYQWRQEKLRRVVEKAQRRSSETRR